MATRVDRRYNHKRIAVDPFDPVRIDQFTDRGEPFAAFDSIMMMKYSASRKSTALLSTTR
jgi:hypothetical protein